MIKAIRIVVMASLFILIFTSALPAEDSRESEIPVGTEKETSEVVESPIAAATPQPDQTAVLKSEPFTAIEPYEESFQPQSGNFLMSFLRAVGGLGFVLCLMVALYYAGRKYFPKYFIKADSGKNLKLIETLSMGDRRSISIIQVEDKHFLIGNTPNQINLLASISKSSSKTSEIDADPPSLPAEDKNESRSTFRNLFEVEKKRSPQPSGSPLPEDVRMKMRLLREALER